MPNEMPSDRGDDKKAPATKPDLSVTCPQCQTAMLPEHAHYRCPRCHYRDSCCF